MKLLLKSRKGNAALSFIVCAAFFLFVIMPVYYVVVERYILLNKAQIIKDSVDITNTAVYNALNPGSLGKDGAAFDNGEALAIYTGLLAKNLNLNEDLTPKLGSAADEKVTIDSLVLYTSGIPAACPNGSVITRPTIHSCITVPVKPSLYRRVINGGQMLLLKVHVDSEIPINN